MVTDQLQPGMRGRTGVARRPGLIVFDVNETLSDMAPMAAHFREAGLPEHLAPTWFAGLLRDGFALTVTGAKPAFADLATDALRRLLADRGASQDAPEAAPGGASGDARRDAAEDAVSRVMSGFSQLPVHADVVSGIRSLSERGLRLVTLSNGSAAVAQGLVERNAIEDCFERLLSVQDAPAWKPAAAAYRYALTTCDVEPADAMLVAVHPWDIHGAHDAGLATAWLNRSGSPYPETMHRADLEVASLAALAEALDRASGVG